MRLWNSFRDIPISERYDNIEEVYQEYRHALAQTNLPAEMIFVCGW